MMVDHPWFARNHPYPYVKSRYMPASWEGHVITLLFLLLLMAIVWRFGRTPMTFMLIVPLVAAFALLVHWTS